MEKVKIKNKNKTVHCRKSTRISSSMAPIVLQPLRYGGSDAPSFSLARARRREGGGGHFPGVLNIFMMAAGVARRSCRGAGKGGSGNGQGTHGTSGGGRQGVGKEARGCLKKEKEKEGGGGRASLLER